MSDSAIPDCPYVDVDAVEQLHKEVGSAHSHPGQKGMHHPSKAGIGFLLVVEVVEGVCNPVE
jgi:hypothetical protein